MSTPHPAQGPQGSSNDPAQTGWQQPTYGQQASDGQQATYGQQAPGPQQPPVPQAQFPGGQGYLAVNMLKPSGIGSASMISPLIAIDGYPAPAVWERNVFPVPVGRRRITTQSTYLWTFGRAELDVDVAPEQTVEVYYAGPVITFMGGRIGFEPQKRGGMVPLIVLLAFVVLVIVLAIVGAALSG